MDSNSVAHTNSEGALFSLQNTPIPISNKPNYHLAHSVDQSRFPNKPIIPEGLQTDHMREPIPWQRANLYDPISLSTALFEPSIKCLVPPTTYECGDFSVSLDHTHGENVVLSIYDRTAESTVGSNTNDAVKGALVFQTVKGEAFLKSGNHHLDITDTRGSYSIKRDIRDESRYQTVDHFEQMSDGSIIIHGRLLRHKFDDDDHLTRYRIRITEAPSGQIDINIRASLGNFIHLDFTSNKEEKIFGFGEQFSHINLKGELVPILVQEQGIGRGHPLITPLVNFASDGSGGSTTSTSFPMPHFFTNENRSLYLLDKAYSEFDLRDPKRVTIRFFENEMTARVSHFTEPLDHISTLTEHTGRMAEPPKWIHDGIVLAIQGGEERVLTLVNRCKDAGIPITGVWIQDWCGKRKTDIGSQLWWDWKPDYDLYPNWDQMIKDLRAEGIRVGAYINPMIVDREAEEQKMVKGAPLSRELNPSEDDHAKEYIAAKIESGIHSADLTGPDVERGEATGVPRHESLYKEAMRKGYLVKKNGKIAEVANTTFSAALVDLTNKDAREWLKSIIQREFINRGISFWMADYGESLDHGADLCCGLDPAEQHNVFPELFAQTNFEIVDECGMRDELLPFLRSGYTQSLGFSSMFWEADQMTIGPGHDGMESSLKGLLSSGLSGISNIHSDTGGYTSISMKTPLGIIGWARQPWLLCRWGEQNMLTGMFRFHESVQPENSAQAYDTKMLPYIKQMATIFVALKEYRMDLFKTASEKGWPVNRHTMLHYFNDPNTHGLESQFLLGKEIIEAPIFHRGQTSVSIYLPQDKWVHLWSGKEYDCTKSGQTIKIKAPIGQPAIFYQKDSKAGAKLRAMVVNGDLEL